jgi:Holliday junction resolvase RusA-like endonuclease
MQPQTLTIPGDLTDLNQFIGDTNANRFIGNKTKRRNTEIVAWYAKVQLKPVTSYPVDFTFRWICKNTRKDKDNIAFARKFIFDGLVEAGILEGDGWKQIGDWTDQWEVDASNPRIEVVIHLNEQGNK